LGIDGLHDREPQAQQRGQPGILRDATEEVHRLGTVFLEHAHQDQVHSDLENPAIAVLALTGPAWVVLHDHFADARPVHAGEHRDEPVHFAVQSRIADDVGPVGLQRATVVMQSYPGHTANDPVGDARNQGAQPRVLAVLAPAADHVVAALLQNIAQTFDLFGRILPVAVQRHDDRGPGRPETGHQGGGLPIVARQVNDAQPRIVRRQLIQQRAAPVAAAIVDGDQLEAAPLARQHRQEVRKNRWYAGFFLEDGNDY